MTAARIARAFWLAVALVAAVALASAVRMSRTSDHAVRASFDAAVGLAPGMDVQLDGLDVGKVKEVSYDGGRAEVVLGINDGPAWPLPRGSKAITRFGTTIGSATRRVDLVLGPRSAAPIPDGGIIAASSTQTAVEWHEVFATLDRDARIDARRLAARGVAVLDRRDDDLNRGLAATPGAVDALDGVLGDLAGDRALLARLIPQTDRVTRTLAARDDAISALVLVAGRTLNSFARRNRDVRATLDALPGTLDALTSSLDRVRHTSRRLRPVLADLGPGARELRTLDRDLAPALRALRAVTPAGLRLAATARRTGTPVERLLAALGPLLGDRAAPVLEALAPMLDCIAPYAPELGGFFATWGSWNHRSDATGNYGRYHIIEGSPSLASLPGASLQTIAKLPGIRYARALAPGELAGRPRELPRCGYTSALRDPSTDPEAGG
jgi:virulence factor Mce-like protein